MPSADVQNMIPTICSYFASKPVERAYLFGSCSRGEERKDSDVDIMVDLIPGSKMGLAFYGMMVDLEDLLRRPVDIVRRGYLQSYAEPSAEHDKLLIYERAS